jgi:DNA-binding CsgD family transcriptional regulator
MHDPTLVVFIFALSNEMSNLLIHMIVNYIIIFVLIQTIAITSGGILISSHLRTTYKAEIFSTLLFFQVFYFIFGFYALWGQMIMHTYLTPYVTPETLGRIIHFTTLLGTPFLIFASLMFIRFTKEISGRKAGNVFALWYLFFNIMLVFCLGYIIIKYPVVNILVVIKYYYIIFNFIYIIFGTSNLLTKSRNARFRNIDLRNISIGLLSIMLIQNVIVFFYNQNIFIALVFIFAYFILGGMISVYIKYYADLSKILPEIEISKSFEIFCNKHEISKREKEIINEICKGYTNQQIADKLFISLQTVKDHTHRIYNKTLCTSRTQLIFMVNEEVG